MCTIVDGVYKLHDLCKILFYIIYITRNVELPNIPGAPRTNFNDRGGGGGVWQTFIFYTQKKTHLQNLSTQKSIPQKIP